MPSNPPPAPGAAPRWRPLRRTSDRIARAFGVGAADREATVAAIIARYRVDAPGYWFQIVVATGIATLGLTLNSTAVVIGAMLISPLMGPIVGIGMALAIGSPYLAIRAATRLGASVGVVVASSSLLTRVLPYHEVTAEIAARTTPTLLDLSVAGFCALSAGYTTTRPGSDTSATAAGTAIGIALVPPLCVVGFGLGLGRGTIAFGASLLFVANLCAIVALSVMFFVALGFDLVDGLAHEARDVAAPGRIARIAARARTLFGSRYGPVFRFVVPALFFAAVFVPLRRALAEVTWQVRTRGAVERIVANAAPPDREVRTTLSIGQHTVLVRLVLMDQPARAREVEQLVRDRVAAASGVTPTVSVTAVPDFASLRAISAEQAAAVLPRSDGPPPLDLAELRGRVGDALGVVWPGGAAGPLFDWRLALDADERATLDLTHVGAALGGPGATLLERDLARALGGSFTVREHAIDAREIVADPTDPFAWLPALARALETVRAEPRLRACVSVPADAPAVAAAERVRREHAPTPPRPGSDPGFDRAAHALISDAAAPRVEQVDGDHWGVRVTDVACPALDRADAGPGR